MKDLDELRNWLEVEIAEAEREQIALKSKLEVLYSLKHKLAYMIAKQEKTS